MGKRSSHCPHEKVFQVKVILCYCTQPVIAIRASDGAELILHMSYTELPAKGGIDWAPVMSSDTRVKFVMNHGSKRPIL